MQTPFNIDLNTQENKNLIKALLEAVAIGKAPYQLGSITLENAAKLRSKLEYENFCVEHQILYEDMTEDDFEIAFFEKDSA